MIKSVNTLLFLCKSLKKRGVVMYDENQIVQVKWNNNNKEWYESKGYIFTKRNNVFDIAVKDLMPHSNKKIIVTCDYCGKEYITQYNLILNGRDVIQKDCCPNCTGKKTSEVSKQRRSEKYIGLARKVCEENGYMLITTVDEYIDIKMNICFICPKHGEQKMMLDNFIRGHKCKLCSYEERGENLKHDTQYIKECIESVNGNKWLNPEEYQGTFVRNLNIECSCGKSFITSFSNYHRYGVDKCFSCSCKVSKGEERIEKFLKINDIDFVTEKRFDDCRDIKPLPFDFYLPKYNLIIEFDGQHHYKTTYSVEHYETTVRHDKIKNDYCKSHNIDLLRIPYWECNNIESIIADELNL